MRGEREKKNREENICVGVCVCEEKTEEKKILQMHDSRKGEDCKQEKNE